MRNITTILYWGERKPEVDIKESVLSSFLQNLHKSPNTLSILNQLFLNHQYFISQMLLNVILVEYEQNKNSKHYFLQYLIAL